MAGVWHQAGCCCVAPPGGPCTHCQTGSTPSCVRVTISGLIKCEDWPFSQSWLETAYNWIVGTHVLHQVLPSNPCQWASAYSWQVSGSWHNACVSLELTNSKLKIRAWAYHGAFYTGSFFYAEIPITPPINCSSQSGSGMANAYDAEDCNGLGTGGVVAHSGEASYKMGVPCLANILLRDCETSAETVTAAYLDDWYFGRVLLTSASQCILVVGRTNRPAEIANVPAFANVLDSCEECLE